jgi:hypothetical protein
LFPYWPHSLSHLKDHTLFQRQDSRILIDFFKNHFHAKNKIWEMKANQILLLLRHRWISQLLVQRNKTPKKAYTYSVVLFIWSLKIDSKSYLGVKLWRQAKNGHYRAGSTAKWESTCLALEVLGLDPQYREGRELQHQGSNSFQQGGNGDREAHLTQELLWGWQCSIFQSRWWLQKYVLINYLSNNTK